MEDGGVDAPSFGSCPTCGGPLALADDAGGDRRDVALLCRAGHRTAPVDLPTARLQAAVPALTTARDALHKDAASLRWLHEHHGTPNALQKAQASDDYAAQIDDLLALLLPHPAR
jgi:hypothetical protein